MAKLKAHLVIIDPQNDFCDIPDSECPSNKRPQLPVPGSHADMGRIASMIGRIGRKLDDVHVTMDSHRRIDVAHPLMWIDQHGNPPGPFTFITHADVAGGIWAPRVPQFRKRMLDYTAALEATGKFTLCIWPTHCLIGTWGASIHDAVNDALQKWSSDEFAMVDYVTKGSNVWTEHYGALMAEVTDPSDPGTALNTNFLTTVADADIIGICGQASTHCVWNTVEQIGENIGQQHLKKFQLLLDGMSPVVVPGVKFPDIRDMEKRYGMTLSTTVDFLL